MPEPVSRTVLCEDGPRYGGVSHTPFLGDRPGTLALGDALASDPTTASLLEPRGKNEKIKDLTFWPTGNPGWCGARRRTSRGTQIEGSAERRTRHRRGPPAWRSRRSFVRDHRQGCQCCCRPSSP